MKITNEHTTGLNPLSFGAGVLSQDDMEMGGRILVLIP